MTTIKVGGLELPKTRVKTIEFVDSGGEGSTIHVTQRVLIDGHEVGPTSIRGLPAGLGWAPRWDIERTLDGVLIVTLLFDRSQVAVSEPIERPDGGDPYREVVVIARDLTRLLPWRPAAASREEAETGVFEVTLTGRSLEQLEPVELRFVAVRMFAEQVLFRQEEKTGV